MENRAGQRWLLAAVLVFLTLLAIWAVAAIQLTSASAGDFPFTLSLRSQLGADYGQDAPGHGIGSLSLSIVGDVLRDIGLAPAEADSQQTDIELALVGVVPTATARDFEGNPPFTATPTHTPLPTNTPTPLPTSTPTNTPTKTPQPTATPTAVPPTPVPPTATVKPPANTPIPEDTKPPIIKSGWTLSPTPGPIEGCEVTVVVDDLRVYDEAYSSGIKDVFVKYYVNGWSDGYVYSEPFELCTGGAKPDGSWDGCYKGSTTIKVYNLNPAPPADGTNAPIIETSPTPSSNDYYYVTLWAKAIDNAGHETYRELTSGYAISAWCAGQ